MTSVCSADLVGYFPDPTNTGSRTLYCNPKNKLVDHFALLVGYTDTEWIIKNSWGQSWGLNGYAYISRNPSKDCCIGNQLHTTGSPTSNCSIPYCQQCTDLTSCTQCQTGRYLYYNSTTGVYSCELCTAANCAACYDYTGTCKWCY